MSRQRIGPNKYSKVSSCSITKEIWDKLKVTHEGTSQVKKSKIKILTLNYETFKMVPKKDIKTMSNRFTIIINSLKSYGKIYPNEDVGLNKKKVVKIKVGVTLKSTTNEGSESSEEVDGDKEIVMFARRFKRFTKSNKGRRFQKNK
ncbi:hypothetical protein J1N35_011323 [Gossypium stocksii]|uniref:UBN2 domain-containing protein n=1 Tax=Gossypium stocksii TaxID=47602 RepID=A0A9D3W3S5_9ROSI|nr:hypothetical protein J1N35_011323 [Gossypium stocksii]